MAGTCLLVTEDGMISKEEWAEHYQAAGVSLVKIQKQAITGEGGQLTGE
jgi:hypothetical protein